MYKFRLLLWLAVLLPALCLANDGRRRFVRPPYLQVGDTVGVVAPASRLADDADTARVRQHFEAMGLHVKFGAHILARDGAHFSATDAERAADMQAMLDDDNVRAVVAFKGGYGSVRLLDRVDMRRLRRNPKWIVGYSDITMLHLALRGQGIESLHATMPVNFEYDSLDVSACSLRQALFGELERMELPAHPCNRLGDASGRLAGGNLAVLCAALGTPEEPDFSEPTVLLIEDVGEHAYRIDRMMQQLQRSGKLRQVKAILVGYFTRIGKAEKFSPDGGIAALIRSYTDPLGIPVAFGVPAGHELPNMALYMGRKMQVHIDDRGAIITF